MVVAGASEGSPPSPTQMICQMDIAPCLRGCGRYWMAVGRIGARVDWSRTSLDLRFAAGRFGLLVLADLPLVIRRCRIGMMRKIFIYVFAIPVLCQLCVGQAAEGWETVAVWGEPTARHESAMVAFDGKAYLMGGTRAITSPRISRPFSEP